MATILKADGKVEAVIGTGERKRLTLEQMQAAVGGWIQPVPGTNYRAWCNEEGRLQRLPLNVQATSQFHQQLVGDVLVLTEAEAKLAMDEEDDDDGA